MQPAVMALILATAAVGSNDPTAASSCARCHGEVTVTAPHAEVVCEGCHPGAEETPHTAALAVDCRAGGCHPERRSQIRRTVHERTASRNWLTETASCVACHGGHEIRTGVAAVCASSALDDVCRACHDRSRPCRYEGPHGPAPVENVVATEVSTVDPLPCTSCHGSHLVRDLDDPLAPLARSLTASTCGRCHPDQQVRFARSRHARGVREGVRTAPTCLGCHEGAGPSPRADHAMSSERVVTTCTGCHEDPAVLATSELPLEIVEGYEESAHGVAFLHGATDVAVCASCHDPHQVLPPNDPDSKVNPHNVRSTCMACHDSVDDDMLRSAHRPAGEDRMGSPFDRLQVFFPVAGRSVNLVLVAGVGAGVGVLSGFFGVGASFLMTPLLIFIGIPAAVAVATDSAHLTAVATANAARRGVRGTFDPTLAAVLVTGGWIGGSAGVLMVRWLRELGAFDAVLRLVFVVILGFIGASTLLDVLRTLRRPGVGPAGQGRVEGWLGRLPLSVFFRRSGVRASLVLLAGTGLLVGVLAALLGVSGGFLMLPVLIYVAGVPNRIAVGTDLFQIILTCGLVALLHAITNHTVDAMLAGVLFVGSVAGVRVGGALARRIHGELVGLSLALVVIAVAVALAWQLVVPPDNLVVLACWEGLSP